MSPVPVSLSGSDPAAWPGRASAAPTVRVALCRYGSLTSDAHSADDGCPKQLHGGAVNEQALAATDVAIAPAPPAGGLEPDDVGARSRRGVVARLAAFAKNWGRTDGAAERGGGLTRRDLRRLLGMFLLSRMVILSIAALTQLQTRVKHDPIPALEKWDTGWFLGLVKYWYQAPVPGNQSSTAFFPAWPLTLKVVHHLFGMQSWDVDGPAFGRVAFLVANACACVALIAACAYLRATRGPTYDYTAFAVLFLFGPFSLYMATILSEPMFAMFVAITFWASSRHRYLLAGLAVAGAGATRATGILLILVPIAFSYLEVAGRPSPRALGAYLRRLVRSPRLLAGLAMAPMGLVAYMGYLWVRFGNPLSFVDAEATWGRAAANPLVTLWEAATFQGPVGWGDARSQDFLYLMVIFAAVWVLTKAFRGTWLAEAPQALALIFIALDSPVVGGPLLQSVPRFLAGVLVVQFAAADLLNRSPKYRQVAIACLVLVEFGLLGLWISSHTMFIA